MYSIPVVVSYKMCMIYKKKCKTFKEISPNKCSTATCLSIENNNNEDTTYEETDDNEQSDTPHIS